MKREKHIDIHKHIDKSDIDKQYNKFNLLLMVCVLELIMINIYR